MLYTAQGVLDLRNTPTDPRWNILQIQRAFLAAIDALRGES